MLRDDGRVSISASAYSIEGPEVVGEEESTHERVYENDDLDDVFGSGPPSPTFEHDDGTNENIWHGNSGNAEVSDVPRLKEKHETEGYRDGVTKGKAQTVQAGFDEGYGLGAVLGLRIGKILGLLDGICSAVGVGLKSGGTEVLLGEKERLDKLFASATVELKTESVFARQWWGEDGIWKFEVLGEGYEGMDVVFSDVAGAHPLVTKWERILDKEVQKWSLDLGLMEQEHLDTTKVDGAIRLEHAGEGPVPAVPGAQKQEFSW
ncbi:hypothetical protein G7Y89_g3417 [Cudoniella acicularis]|uniref:Protein YAE1 n=1 Tax=Cudoniella acicularis TaxID=354080 RepID=A0A8H4RSL3_9HELO|nr:hypothetical protein G7Y89_g3417 [Cudoniella acicularis]